MAANEAMALRPYSLGNRAGVNLWEVSRTANGFFPAWPVNARRPRKIRRVAGVAGMAQPLRP